MAYDKAKKEYIIFPKVEQLEEYRSANARKVNSAKKPHGYLYVLQNYHFDLVKIGVSAAPKRRIRDIKSYVPFKIDYIYKKLFIDVYSLEEIIHDVYKENRIKGEWYQIHKDDVLKLIEFLNETD